MWIRDLEKPTGPQVVKKFPAFYGTCRFITAFKIPSPLPILSQISPFHASPQSNVLKLCFNSILRSMPEYSSGEFDRPMKIADLMKMHFDDTCIKSG